MTKKELAKKLAKQCDLSQVQALEIANAIFGAKPGEGIISTELSGGGKVVIPGFGTFDVRTRASRTAVNPNTGKKIQVGEKKVVAFKAGKTLRERVVR